jgi:hypothetical protein
MLLVGGLQTMWTDLRTLFCDQYFMSASAPLRVDSMTRDEAQMLYPLKVELRIWDGAYCVGL